jgi:hypothetical protein
LDQKRAAVTEGEWRKVSASDLWIWPAHLIVDKVGPILDLLQLTRCPCHLFTHLFFTNNKTRNNCHRLPYWDFTRSWKCHFSVW